MAKGYLEEEFERNLLLNIILKRSDKKSYSYTLEIELIAQNEGSDAIFDFSKKTHLYNLNEDEGVDDLYTFGKTRITGEVYFEWKEYGGGQITIKDEQVTVEIMIEFNYKKNVKEPRDLLLHLNSDFSNFEFTTCEVYFAPKEDHKSINLPVKIYIDTKIEIPISIVKKYYGL